MPSNIFSRVFFSILFLTSACVHAQNADLGTWHAYGGISDGCSGTVLAEAADANGDLYVGGAFRVCGDVAASTIARWDGTSWSALGAGTNGSVNAIAISGSNVYVAGQFTSAGGIPANNVARWDGSSWHALGGGVDGTASALLVVGTDVYIGGGLDSADAIAVAGIAHWNGSAWSSLGSGLTISGSLGIVNALTTYGGHVVAAGRFDHAGGNAANNIASWDGSAWSPLGSGVGSSVNALATVGTTLYAGGTFSSAGGNAAGSIAAWDGASWSTLGTGPENGVAPAGVSALVSDGTQLYVGGQFTSAGGSVAQYIASWDGSHWSTLGAGFQQLLALRVVRALAIARGTLYAGGAFNSAGVALAHFIASWDGISWAPLSAPPGNGIPSALQTLTTYAGNICLGAFWPVAYGQGQLVCETGNGWSALGAPFEAFNGVEALAASGNNLYIGYGGFGPCCLNLWGGGAISGVGPGGAAGMDSDVLSITVSGNTVYAGGAFTTAGGVAANRIAQWDGAAWHALGSGMDGNVNALAISGSTLYAAGFFSDAGGVPVSNIAQWNGTAWSALGSGLDDAVFAMIVVGNNLYVGGQFTHAGLLTVNGLARWDGSAWSSVGSGISNASQLGAVNALAALGGNVYFAGQFDTAGTTAVKDVAIWNGSTFLALGGVGDGVELEGQVSGLSALNGDIYLGGQFGAAGGKVSSAIARYTPDDIFHNGLD